MNIRTALVKIAQMGPANVRFNIENSRRIQKAIEGGVDSVRESVDSIRYTLNHPHTLHDEAIRYPSQESDPYYYNILVGGANAGGKGFFGLSELPFGVLAKGNNRILFRNGQEKEIRDEIDRAINAGLHPRVVGHSWGGSRIANIAKDYPGIPFIAMDPVSWTHRLKKTPKNLTIYYPKPGTGQKDQYLTTKLAPILGGRWPRNIEGDGKILEYDGDHVDGVGEALTAMNRKSMRDRMTASTSEDNASYVKKIVGDYMHGMGFRRFL